MGSQEGGREKHHCETGASVGCLPDAPASGTCKSGPGVARAHAWPGDQTHNLGTRPGWSRTCDPWVTGRSSNQLSPTGQGTLLFFLFGAERQVSVFWFNNASALKPAGRPVQTGRRAPCSCVLLTVLGVGPCPSQLRVQLHPHSSPQARETAHFQRHRCEPEERKWQGQVGDGSGP